MATVASATSSTTLLAANAQRKGFVITNDDANRLYVQLGNAAASSSSYSFSLAQNENASLAGYTGHINGIWAADGAGNAQVTEY